MRYDVCYFCLRPYSSCTCNIPADPKVKYIHTYKEELEAAFQAGKSYGEQLGREQALEQLYQKSTPCRDGGFYDIALPPEQLLSLTPAMQLLVEEDRSKYLYAINLRRICTGRLVESTTYISHSLLDDSSVDIQLVEWCAKQFLYSLRERTTK